MDEQKQSNRVNIGHLIAKQSNAGFMVLKDGKIELRGFDGLMDHKAKIDIRGGVMLIAPDDDLPGTECVRFSEENLASPSLIDYFKEHNAIGCLFVRVYSVWTQAVGVFVEGLDDEE